MRTMVPMPMYMSLSLSGKDARAGVPVQLPSSVPINPID